MAEAPMTFRTMTRTEIELAVAWAGLEGWNPGLRDADSFYSADAEGFLLGLLGEVPVACISAVKYGRNFGFIGFYIVHPGYRGRGHGLQIWNEAMRRMENRVVGLDGVVAQQANYRKSGFEWVHANIRYQGSGGGEFLQDDRIVDLATIPFEEIGRYDEEFFPEDRRTFLRNWIGQPGCVALGLREAGRLAGYGVIRPCRSGFKIGPLFADAADGAELLFRALKARAREGEPVFLDIPEPNREAGKLVACHGMKKVFETARMYKGAHPALPLERIYGITSFELG